MFFAERYNDDIEENLIISRTNKDRTGHFFNSVKINIKIYNNLKNSINISF